MKHGVAFRGLSRTSSHRNLMLRNMVTSLLEHEQIKTTLPKAREAARLAEKIITLGKKSTPGSRSRASAFLLDQKIIPKLFGPLAHRYADRPGGYTRIHKYGNREGDNAATAILELVDNPRDLRWEITSRAIGWELLSSQLKHETPHHLVNRGFQDTHTILDQERRLNFPVKAGKLRPKTRWNLQKVLKFRDQSAPMQLGNKVSDYMDHLLATAAVDAVRPKAPDSNVRIWSSRRIPTRPLPPPGQMRPGETRNALQLARGVLGSLRPKPNGRVLGKDTLND